MSHRRRPRRPVPVIDGPVTVEDLAQDGRGVARVGGKVLFVAGALPGERVRVRVLRAHREFNEAETTSIELASPDRVAPACPHFGVCGGCALQHLAPAAQVAFKQKQLVDALARIGNVRADEIAAPVTGPVWHYRRRARLGVRWVYKKERALVGFRERDAPKIAILTRCDTLDERVGLRLEALSALVGGLSIRERIPQIEVAAAESHVALVWRVLAPPTAEDRAALSAFAGREGFAFYLQSGGADSLEALPPLRPPLSYSPDGSAIRLRFAPLDFVQVNVAVSQQMVRQALAWLAPEPGAPLLELFSGIGNFSLPLAAAGAHVTAVEGEAALVERARANARTNGLEIRFERADLFAPAASAPWLDAASGGVLLDPPRAGAQEILSQVAERAPPRILYVSCHPGTLARDAGTLVRVHGYHLRRAGVLDMFPHTAHVESMALFER
ncbi:MAG TPA: 23S rRNA (uracil(1939)-C(5))-methyltransferase RlmD [Nevskiaceae bacterium]